MSLIIFLFCAHLTIISSVDDVVHDFYWRDYTHKTIPRDAFQGAPGLYIGQINTKERNTVANIYPSTGNAIAVHAGEVLVVQDDIKILSSAQQRRIYWEPVDLDKPQDQQLQDAIRGGYHNNTLDPLFIGKVMHQGEWKIGKVHTYKHNDNRGIWVWDQRQQPVNIHQFDILKYNLTIPDLIQQNFYWRDYVHGNIPYDAIEGAPETYIGQVIYQGSFLVATISPYKTVARAEFGGMRSIEKNIKIMCSSEPNRFYWENFSSNKSHDEQLKDVVVGGYQENIASNLFIGRIFHQNEYKIGKVVPINNVTTILYVPEQGGGNDRILDFEILKYN